MLYVPTTPVPTSIGTHAIPEMSLGNHRHDQVDITEEQQTEEFYYHSTQYLDNKPMDKYQDHQQETPTGEEDEDEFFFLNQHENTPGLLDEYMDFKQVPFDPLPQPQQLVLPAVSSTSKSDLVPNENLQYTMATRTFYATINKFARQNHPECRRRTPYSFLENWHLHNMYSKSQQILLGISNVRPTVLLSGDDFMFTPPLTPQSDPCDHIDLIPLDWDEDDEEDADVRNGYGYVDAYTIMDSGVVMMAAPAPEGCCLDTDEEDVSLKKPGYTTCDSEFTICPMLDENSWMGQGRHQKLSSYTSSNDYPAGDHTSAEYCSLYQHQHQQLEGDEDGEESFGGSGLTMSPELVNWYRSEQTFPSSIVKYQTENNKFSQTAPAQRLEIGYDERNAPISREQTCMETSESVSDRISIMTGSSSSEQFPSTSDPASINSPVVSYQSLADIMTIETNNGMPVQTACPSSSYTYGAIQSREKTARVTGRLPLRVPDFSGEIWRTSELALELAESFSSNGDHTLNDEELGRIPITARQTNQILRFILFTIQIWHVLFICAESILGDLGCILTRRQVHLIATHTPASKQPLTSTV
ncbi:hypothetical protein EC973_004150 [Apophysomyces ossiformis]|uniref:Uncharacterized protein n=1 Tax=Apophysomyces ossiformis TaxID=679940 RepID=A0A8H7BEW7_9FUNG|nr:hypothetical protein EC973_004150 [Apophysomyces ossiformis]